MDNGEYLTAIARGEPKKRLSLACSTAGERRLDSECFASPAELTVSKKELLVLGKVQVVRWPAKRGRPAQNRDVRPGGGESA